MKPTTDRETFGERVHAVRGLVVDALAVAVIGGLGLAHVISPVETVALVLMFAGRYVAKERTHS